MVHYYIPCLCHISGKTLVSVNNINTYSKASNLMALTNYTTLLSSGSSTKNYPKVYHILSLVGYLLSSSIDEIVSPIEYIYQQLI